MKITALSLVFSVLITATVVHAQDQDFNEGLKQELSQDVEQMYPKRPKQVADSSSQTTTKVEVVKTQTVQPAPAAPAPVQVQAAPAQVTVQPQVQPIYILSQPQSAPAAQVQPTTTVEAAQVKESRVDQLRKQREEVEHQTEDKLMQRLEDDRLLSEKERSERLMSPLAAPSPAAAPVMTQTYQSAQTVALPAPAAPTVTVTPEAPVASAIATSKTDINVNTSSDEEEKSTFSIGGQAGVGSYPTVNNVDASYAAGVSAKVIFPDRLGVEADVLFSSYDVKNANPCTGFACLQGASLVKQLNQMNVTGGLTYNILSGRVSPVVGVLGGYTRRTYSDRVTYGYSGTNGTAGSNAFDAGLLVGVDINATKRLSVGADLRYMMNVSYRTDDALAYWGPIFGTPLEGLNYYIATLNLKLSL